MDAGFVDAGVVVIDEPDTIRVMTFNIKHLEVTSLTEVAEAIRAEEPDIVALQEVDVDAERSGVVDQPHRLGQLTGMTDLFRGALTLADGGRFGLSVLSRFPILTSSNTPLTSTGEQRIVITADLLGPGDEIITVGVAHLGLDAAERAVQAQEVINELKDRPLILVMGDFNAPPDSPEITLLTDVFPDAWALVGEGDGFTVPAVAPTSRIDYVLLGPDWDAVAAHVPETLASDHRLVVVDITR